MQVTTVAAQGTAETDYDLATFTVNLSETASTVPSAKARLQQKVEQLDEGLVKMREKLELEFVKNSVRKTSNVHEKYEYIKNTHTFMGYEMTYSVSFQINDLDQVSAVYDALTSLPEVRVSNPQFILKNHDKLNKRALKKAWEKVSERFQTECETLGLDVADYEVGTWEATYSDSHRSDRMARGTQAYAMIESASAPGAPVGGAAARNSEPLEIVVGLATVTANLEVGYVRRANTSATVKATVVSPPHAAPESRDPSDKVLV